MLFRKKQPKSCTYCKYGTKMDQEAILCIKHGVVCKEKGCSKFSYDPYKRIPARPKAFNLVKFNDDDFTL